MNLNDLSFVAQSYDHHDGGWVVMGIGMLAFWVLVIALIVWLVRAWGPAHHHGPARPETPLEVLDRRLAEGATSIEEYEQRRRILSEGGAG